jgi:hypothetical protein
MLPALYSLVVVIRTTRLNKSVIPIEYICFGLVSEETVIISLYRERERESEIE